MQSPTKRPKGRDLRFLGFFKFLEFNLCSVDSAILQLATRVLGRTPGHVFCTITTVTGDGGSCHHRAPGNFQGQSKAQAVAKSAALQEANDRILSITCVLDEVE